MEGREKDNIEQSELDYINAKRTYDAYQDLDLVKARAAQKFNEQVAQDLHALTMRVMNNSVTVDHMNDLRAAGHAELATDRMWNVDEVAELVAKTPVFLDSIAAAVTAAVQKAVAGE
jgi:hypothetical protein